MQSKTVSTKGELNELNNTIRSALQTVTSDMQSNTASIKGELNDTIRSSFQSSKDDFDSTISHMHQGLENDIEKLSHLVIEASFSTETELVNVKDVVSQSTQQSNPKIEALGHDLVQQLFQQYQSGN